MNPEAEQRKRVQRKIAEVQGWTNLIMSKSEWDKVPVLVGLNPKDNIVWNVPNWPGSIDTARGLEIGEGQYQRAKFAKALGRITGGSLKIIFYTAYQWCLAWLLYMGWRWEEKTLEFERVK